jgi:hypothetical protein
MKNEIMEKQAWGVTAEAVKEQIHLIQQVMRDHMLLGEHYGTIPGVKKNILFKAGAEKLCLLFRLAPRFTVDEDTRDVPPGHKTFRVKCELVKITDGTFWGEGVGMASTMETKYRFRRGEGENTGRPVPQAYWDERDPELLGGKEFFPSKDEKGKWAVFKKTAPVENQNIADTYNTVLKIAKKRAHVDATITATAASDIFTQDLEETSPVLAKKALEMTVDQRANEIISVLGVLCDGDESAMDSNLVDLTEGKVSMAKMVEWVESKPEWVEKLHAKIMPSLEARLKLQGV